MQFTKIFRLFVPSLVWLCFAVARSDAQPVKTLKPTARINSQTIASTAYIIDRSPMATAVEAQIAGYQNTGSLISNYVRNAPHALFMTAAGSGKRQSVAQTDPYDVKTLDAAIGRFQAAYSNPNIVMKTGGNDTLRQFFQFVHNTFFDQHLPENGILGQVLTASRNNLETLPLGTLTLEKEQARFDAASGYLLEQFTQVVYPLQNDVLTLEERTRALDTQNYFTTRLIYSNAALRTDVIAQYQTGTSEGYGAGLRFSLDGYRLPPEPQPTVSRSQTIAALFALLPDSDINIDVIKDLNGVNFTENNAVKIANDSKKAITQVPPTLARYILKPHFGLSVDYQHTNDIGNYYDAGASASALTPTRIGNRRNAFYYSVGLRYQWFAADAGGAASGFSRSGIGGNLVFAFQDNAPSVDANETGHLGRWHARFGVEYAPQDALSRHDYGAFFLRLRDQGVGEYTFVLGSEVNGQAFIGFNISVYFNGPKRQKFRAKAQQGEGRAEGQNIPR